MASVSVTRINVNLKLMNGDIIPVKLNLEEDPLDTLHEVYMTLRKHVQELFNIDQLHVVDFPEYPKQLTLQDNDSTFIVLITPLLYISYIIPHVMEKYYTLNQSNPKSEPNKFVWANRNGNTFEAIQWTGEKFLSSFVSKQLLARIYDSSQMTDIARRRIQILLETEYDPNKIQLLKDK